MAEASLNIEMFGGRDGAVPSPNRMFRWWPDLDSRTEIDTWDLSMLSRQARSLEANMPAVSLVIETMVDLMGWLQPMPTTQDREWNELARALFERRFSLGNGFDVSGRLSWELAQEWIERRALVDGDCLVVKSRAADGGAVFAFYEAPQLYSYAGSGGQPGVVTDDATRVLYYLVSQDGGSPKYVPGPSGFLYSQKKSPLRVRAVSEIASAVTNASDVQDVQAFTKAGIKFSSSYAVVETKDKDVQRAEAQTAWKNANGMGAGSTQQPANGESANVQPYPPTMPPGMGEPAPRLGSQVVSLGPGRRLEVIHDNRPSNETRSFMELLTGTIAQAVGLDPAVVFSPEKLGSASARYTLQKTRRTIRRRLLVRAAWCLWCWRHFISCEIAAGRLRRCQDEHWDSVRWVPLRDLTIDAGREIAGQINAVRECLADADEWTMATAGKTQKQILTERAETLSYAVKLARELEVPLEMLVAGAVGASTAAPASPEQRNENGNSEGSMSESGDESPVS